MFTTPSFEQIRQIILTEGRNLTGLALPEDSDFAIRAAGTAAAVEGLYSHQQWIARQLFIRTADEYGLAIHAERLSLPRLGGVLATGQVLALGSSSGVTLPSGSRLSDGQGHFWQTLADATLLAGQSIVVAIEAESVGASWNKTARSTLTWVSPVAGLRSLAEIVILSGGADDEPLESWRSRLLDAQALGSSQGRDDDYKLAARGVAGVFHVYVFPKRRGLGSTDVAITAYGSSGADLPSTALLAEVQAALEVTAVAHEDVRAYAPDPVLLDVHAVLTGRNIDQAAVQQIIEDYLDGLAPAEPYRENVLSSKIIGQAGVTDVQLTPAANVNPQVDWTTLEWLRRGVVTVA